MPVAGSPINHEVRTCGALGCSKFVKTGQYYCGDHGGEPLVEVIPYVEKPMPERQKLTVRQIATRFAVVLTLATLLIIWYISTH